jgi:hypothetical protein
MMPPVTAGMTAAPNDNRAWIHAAITIVRRTGIAVVAIVRGIVRVSRHPDIAVPDTSCDSQAKRAD